MMSNTSYDPDVEADSWESSQSVNLTGTVFGQRNVIITTKASTFLQVCLFFSAAERDYQAFPSEAGRSHCPLSPTT
jgi:hypothetical protein